MNDRVYIAIDLKSFYASVECVDRQLDPLTTNLVVADQDRTEKTICLAVSPALKARGISGRPRLFEVVQKIRQVNVQRQRFAPGRRFSGKSASAPELAANPALKLDCIIVKRFSRILVHLDVDVLDEHFFHSTYFANPQLVGDGAGGGRMTMEKLSEILRLVANESNIAGFTIAEYLPFDEHRLHKMLANIKLFTE